MSITYDIDFVPDSAATRPKLTEAHPLWMDVSGIKRLSGLRRAQGPGHGSGKFTFPDQATASQQDDIGRAHEYMAART